MPRFSFRSPAAAPEALEPDETPEVDFVAYAEDCVLSGSVRLGAGRLSDLVNANDQLELANVLVRDLAGGDPIQLHELAIARDEILVMQATGPRGRADQRRQTRQVPIVVKIGPYEVNGYIHVLPGADAIASLRRGRRMVALSDAAIDFLVGAEPEHHEVSVILVNWALADSIVEVADKPEVIEEVVASGGVLIDLAPGGAPRVRRRPAAKVAGAA
jgi:hypothetical protein